MSRPAFSAEIAAVVLLISGLVVAAPANLRRDGVASTPSQTSSHFNIGPLRAFMYYEESGAFGAQDILAGKVALRNTAVGEGDAEHPSGATLVKVDITGPGFGPQNPGVVKLVAKTPSRVLLDQRVSLKLFFSQHRVSIPFLVYGTGCEPVKLTATIEGAPTATKMITSTVPFQCGE